MGQSQSTGRSHSDRKSLETLCNHYTEAKQRNVNRNEERPRKEAEYLSAVHCKLKELPIFVKPVCLVSTDRDGNLIITEAALKQIEQIDMPMVVVSIAGLYRTGKSYLMNRLFGKSEGFELGNTTESKTKGIWVWCRPHPKQKDTVLMLLDTEGLGDVAKGDIGHDNKILSMAVLLCNVLVFNMMTTFNQDAVEKLTFVTEVAKAISSKTDKDGTYGSYQLALILPTFVLTLRDVTLKFVKDNIEITPDQFLENSLELKSAEEPNSDRFNRPRECIKTYFPKRKCFAFERPANTTEMMQNLEKYEFSDLSEEFKKATEEFLQFVYSCEPKKLLHTTVTGQMFVDLLESFANSINNGGIPDVDDAFRAVSNSENNRRAEEAVDEFKKHLDDIELPMKGNKLGELCTELANEAMTKFRSQAVFNAETFEQRIMERIQHFSDKKEKQNGNIAKKDCEETLKEVYEDILGDKIRKRKYHKAGGHDRYKRKLAKVEEQFKTKMKNYDDVWVLGAIYTLSSDEYKKNEEDIINSDTRLTTQGKENKKARKQQEQNEMKMMFERCLADLNKEIETQKEERKKIQEQNDAFKEEQRKLIQKLQDDASIVSIRINSNLVDYIWKKFW